ncbi:TorF family putative porin [Phycisphaera mikurensis]|uniref:Uncharacterized protein n=1 Tax=Phycisphaera mikurensis (strain NBRC 102666 / KCTC 22515 / FYK2301M01) TaxID=1142394 RepID=I0IB08_PHYMF|nr:TorF family putative porin [Phycisphaera mikurensis]MBB6442582.1 hypothetical protein [Phycisphaera mikurensis]BAM02446.1 hypothetical protein PSMK_02870 [Phycisphaera mikurensis NBRC 102666]
MASLTKLPLLSGAAAAAVAAALTSTGGAAAQETEMVEDINNGAISWTLGSDIVSKYVFRGYEIQEDGIIVQPYAEFTAGIADGIDVYAGIWNSTGTETNGDNNEHWLEADIYAGVSIGEAVLGAPIAIDVSYVNYTSPNDTFGQYEELDFFVGYDDSDNPISVAPYALLAIEFDTEAAGDDDNIYLELGGEFEMQVVDNAQYPVGLTVPVKLGLSLDEYYVDDEGDNEFFGYLSVGANVGVPLSFIPREYGQWSAAAGLTLFLLNDNAVGLDDGENENFNIVGSVGFALEY